MDNMEALGITVGDIIVVGILGIAALIGISLGLVKALLFVASLAGAAANYYFTYQDVTPYLLE
ncbi:MAG: hypothetical protein VYD85_08720, partial [Pseudomonadota bacterium]|nr:hypothetical protein [Pseudomonadota bacterium]